MVVVVCVVIFCFGVYITTLEIWITKQLMSIMYSHTHTTFLRLKFSCILANLGIYIPVHKSDSQTIKTNKL